MSPRPFINESTRRRLAQGLTIGVTILAALFIFLFPAILASNRFIAASKHPFFFSAVFWLLIVCIYFVLRATVLRRSSRRSRRSRSSLLGARFLGPWPKKRKTSGYVYVLGNESMPGLVKIGMTRRTVEQRVQELSDASGVPMPFRILFKARSRDPKSDEKRAHKALAAFRYQRNREFFGCPVTVAINAVKNACAH